MEREYSRFAYRKLNCWRLIWKGVAILLTGVVIGLLFFPSKGGVYIHNARHRREKG